MSKIHLILRNQPKKEKQSLCLVIKSFPGQEKIYWYEKQSWISQLPIFIQSLIEYTYTNDIDNGEFPKNAQAISNRLRKAQTPLLEGLGIEIIVYKITPE